MIEYLQRLWCRIRGRRFGDWIYTFTGRQHFLLDPRPEEIEIDDIAHGLANTCRYAGQTLDYYSVAEHSVIVSLYVERLALARHGAPGFARTCAFAALLHDASEAYLGDIPSPLKRSPVMRRYRAEEARTTRVIETHFGIAGAPALARRLIAEVDARVTVDEVDEIITDANMDRVRARFGEALGASIACLAPSQAEAVFLDRFWELAPARWLAEHVTH